MEEWYKIVKPALRNAGVTHEEVAVALNLTPGSVSHKLAGRRRASIQQVKVMLQMAGLELKDLENTEGKIATDQLDIKLLDLIDEIPEGIAETLKRGWISQLEEMIKK